MTIYILMTTIYIVQRHDESEQQYFTNKEAAVRVMNEMNQNSLNINKAVVLVMESQEDPMKPYKLTETILKCLSPASEASEAEKRLQRVEEFCGLRKKDLCVPSISVPLHTELKKRYEEVKQKEIDDVTASLASMVPFKILSKIPQKHHEYLSIILRNKSVLYERQGYLYYAYKLFEDFEDVDQDFIDWFTKTINLRI